MNKILRTKNVSGQYDYELVTESGAKFACTRWFETKSDSWHVKLPKDNPSGRTYIRESKITADVYEFETKTNHREGLSGGGWKSKMTTDEIAQVKACEATIEKIKKECQARVSLAKLPDSVEGIEAQIEALLRKQATLMEKSKAEAEELAEAEEEAKARIAKAKK